MKEVNEKFNNIMAWLSLILAIIPLCLCALTSYFVPSKIPLHYDRFGETDRYGYMYEYLIIGGLFLIFPLIMTIIFKKLNISNNTKLVGYLGSICMGIVFGVLMIIFMVKALGFCNTTTTKQNASFWISFVCSIIGCIILFLSTTLPFLSLKKLTEIKAKPHIISIIMGIGSLIIITLTSLFKYIYSLTPFFACILICTILIIVYIEKCKPKQSIDKIE